MEVVGQAGDVYRYTVWARQDQSVKISLLIKAEFPTTLSVSVGSHTVTLQLFDTNRKTITVGTFPMVCGPNHVTLALHEGIVALERLQID
jgi:hypothetical protein